MRCRSRRIAIVVSLLGMGGFLMSGPGTGCGSFIAESGLVTADFCFIFDCIQGPLGGTLDPCSGLGSGDGTVESLVSLPLFTDCSLTGGP